MPEVDEQAIGTYRYRINLTSTVKDGYRVGDATVEFHELATFDGSQPREEIRRRLKDLIEDGQAVAEQLNRQNQQKLTN